MDLLPQIPNSTFKKNGGAKGFVLTSFIKNNYNNIYIVMKIRKLTTINEPPKKLIKRLLIRTIR